MFDLLFSFQGKVERAKFFFTSMIVGVTVSLSLLFLLASFGGMAANTRGMDVGYSDIGGPVILMTMLILGAGVWIQLSLIWKRTRDMNESMTVAYVYVTCWVLSLIPFLGLVFAAVNTILTLVLLFKPSKATGNDAIDPEIFGDKSQADEVSIDPATDFASQLSDSDLIARAAELRGPTSAPSMATPVSPVENAGRAAPKSFGRRSRVQN